MLYRLLMDEDQELPSPVRKGGQAFGGAELSMIPARRTGGSLEDSQGLLLTLDGRVRPISLKPTRMENGAQARYQMARSSSKRTPLPEELAAFGKTRTKRTLVDEQVTFHIDAGQAQVSVFGLWGIARPITSRRDSESCPRKNCC